MSIIGYIIRSPGGLYELSNYEDGPDKGILILTGAPTVFKSLRAARGAIRRSLAYAAAHGYNWQSSQYRVVPVQKVPTARRLRDIRSRG